MTPAGNSHLRWIEGLTDWEQRSQQMTSIWAPHLYCPKKSFVEKCLRNCCYLCSVEGCPGRKVNRSFG